MHIPYPDTEPDEEEPGKSTPTRPPDMEPVVPQEDPPRPDQPGGPPPMIG